MGREGGTYALIMQLRREADIPVGRLGRFPFPAGYYLYVGSALGGVMARVGRHLRSQKKLRWHIDYFLEYAEVVEVWYGLGTERGEGLWVGAAGGLPGARIPVPGFGSSDCSCPAHLFHFPEEPSFELFQAGVGSDLRIRT